MFPYQCNLGAPFCGGTYSALTIEQIISGHKMFPYQCNLGAPFCGGTYSARVIEHAAKGSSTIAGLKPQKTTDSQIASPIRRVSKINLIPEKLLDCKKLPGNERISMSTWSWKKKLIKKVQIVEKLERLENNHISPILSPLEWEKSVHGRSEQRAAAIPQLIAQLRMSVVSSFLDLLLVEKSRKSGFWNPL